MSILYSTGPLENSIPHPTVRVALKALNNSDRDRACVDWTLFALDGHKRVMGSASVTLDPKASAFTLLPVSASEYEVEAHVRGRDVEDTLVAVFGEDVGGNPVDIHRVLSSEMTVIPMAEPCEPDSAADAPSA